MSDRAAFRDTYRADPNQISKMDLYTGKIASWTVEGSKLWNIFTKSVFTDAWLCSNSERTLSEISGGIGVNRPVELELLSTRVLKFLQASSGFFKLKFLEAAARDWITGNWNQAAVNKPEKWCILQKESLSLLKHKSVPSWVRLAELESAAR